MEGDGVGDALIGIGARVRAEKLAHREGLSM
jgi:hypothetical protein